MAERVELERRNGGLCLAEWPESEAAPLEPVSADRNRFHVRLSSLEAIGRERWNSLSARSRTSTIFQTWDWCSTWSASFLDRGEAWILTVEREGELQALAPFVLRRERLGRTLRWLGDGHADYADLITADQTGHAAAAVLEFLSNSPAWSAARLRNTVADGVLHSAVQALVPRSGIFPLDAARLPCPALRLRRDANFTREVRNKKSLKQYHHWFRRQASYRVMHLRDADRIVPWLDAFFNQHVERWSRTPYPSLFSRACEREYYRRMLAELAPRGMVLFSVLEFEERPLAFHFGFLLDGTLTYYKPAYDPAWSNRSPGSVLMKELFDFADEAGLDTFDFSVGDESYKTRFSNDVRDNVDLELYRSRARRGSVRMFREAKNRLKRTPLVRWLRGR